MATLAVAAVPDTVKNVAVIVILGGVAYLGYRLYTEGVAGVTTSIARDLAKTGFVVGREAGGAVVDLTRDTGIQIYDATKDIGIRW